MILYLEMFLQYLIVSMQGTYFFNIFKYYRVVRDKLGRKIHHSNKNRTENPEKGHLVPFKWFSSYQYAVFVGIAERMLRRRELKEPEQPGRWPHLIQSFWQACFHKKTYRTVRKKPSGPAKSDKHSEKFELCHYRLALDGIFFGQRNVQMLSS